MRCYIAYLFLLFLFWHLLMFIFYSSRELFALIYDLKHLDAPLNLICLLLRNYEISSQVTNPVQ